MDQKNRVPFLVISAGLILGHSPGCGSSDTGEEAPSAQEPYRYVFLAQSQGQTAGFARLILDPPMATGQRCPAITGGSSPIQTSRRANPHNFSVDVCEAVIPPSEFGSALSISMGGATYSLPPINMNPTEILVMGDTGCYPGKASEGNCPAGTRAEPFASLAAGAAGSGWDVMLHMGDYNYRGTPGGFYDAGDGRREKHNCDQAPGSGFRSMNVDGTPDNWQNWKDDFFSPAGELLWQAPWVFTRGNHELCSRAGPGWFYFLDSSYGENQRACPTPDPQNDPISDVLLPEPYLVELGSLNVAVLDSANACDAFATPETKQFTDAYTRQFSAIGRMTDGKGPTWLMTHRPIWGVNPFVDHKSTACTSPGTFACLNQTLQTAISSKAGLNGNLPPEITLSLAGHMHKFQSLTFTPSRGAPARVPQIITGDGGVGLDDRAPCNSFGATVEDYSTAGRATGGTMTTKQGTVQGFGFLEVQYNPGGTWSGILEDPHSGARIAACGTTQQANGSVCEFESDLNFEGCS